MKILVFTSAIFLFILAISINIDISVEYDFLQNLGKIKVKLFKFLPIYVVNISLVGGYIKLIKNKRVKQLKIDLKDKNFVYFEQLSKCIKTKRYLIHMELDYILGLPRPDVCALVSSNINSLIGAYFAYIQAREVDVHLVSSSFLSFTDKSAYIYFNMEFLITLFDVLWAATMALHRLRSIYGNKKSRQVYQK